MYRQLYACNTSGLQCNLKARGARTLSAECAEPEVPGPDRSNAEEVWPHSCRERSRVKTELGNNGRMSHDVDLILSQLLGKIRPRIRLLI